VRADTVVIDEHLGFSTYTGNASITQGVVAISAEKIQIFHKKQIISKVIATSTKKKLVHYRQNQFNQSNFVEAVAQKIVKICIFSALIATTPCVILALPV
jgi:lipopolysaccharide transport protein LptA